jgi:hypothetical protein
MKKRLSTTQKRAVKSRGVKARRGLAYINPAKKQ